VKGTLTVTLQRMLRAMQFCPLLAWVTWVQFLELPIQSGPGHLAQIY
jgi:hypothetical protein